MIYLERAMAQILKKDFVDAEDELSFFSHLEVKWKQLEKGEEPKFYDWFQKYAARVFAEAMIKPRGKQQALGLLQLGLPPTHAKVVMLP
jgi:ABC-type transporter MlaC component